MKSREEIAKKYFPCTCGEIYLSRNLTAPDCAFHSLEWDKALEEYAQQSQPSGMRWVRASERLPEDGITKNMKWFNGTSWQPCTGVYSQDRNRIMLCSGLKPVKNFKNIMWLDESSHAGAAEGAPSDNAFMNGGNTESEKSFYAMGYMDRKKASEGMAEALRLKWINLTEDMGRLLSGQRGVSIDKLNKAMNLVQDFVNTMPASLSPGVEDGSGWVKSVDRYPTPADGDKDGNVLGWDKFSVKTHKCHIRDIHQMKMRFTHWQPLPTPPGVEDKANGK